ncbi:MAG TPA: alkaline phosphatase family protein [Candidatus Rubrimentiphilum sp.]|nr:alkaline phosphatase family protein [Candidatus Rubrimentiphilum sp.]
MRFRLGLLCALVLAGGMPSSNAACLPGDLRVPRYAHIFVIVDENKSYERVMNAHDAPAIAAFAQQYGTATQFSAETHPSEPNYVAIVGGSTFGVADDAPFSSPGHTIDAPNLSTQLESSHLTWKGYYESLPAPGSLAIRSGLYASKHSGFLNFRSVQQDPKRSEHLVDFLQLKKDLRSGDIPNFALIVPNLCNDMHGALGGSPFDCWTTRGLIRRGDNEIKLLAGEIMASSAWSSRANAAIVITFDEDDGTGAGGGRIPTIVVTNHGPRHLTDPTPYTHYSLLRTIEDAFGIHKYLEHAGDAAAVPMAPLFQTSATQARRN